MERKSSANESLNLPRSVEASFVKIEAELGVKQPIKGRFMSPARIGAESIFRTYFIFSKKVDLRRRQYSR
jgi:hypothetical protein